VIRRLLAAVVMVCIWLPGLGTSAVFGHDAPVHAAAFAARSAAANGSWATTSRVSPRLAAKAGPRAIGPIGNPGAFAFEGTTGLASKGSAREVLSGLDATSAQLQAANRAIGRATSSSSINVGRYGERVVVQIRRPGTDGYQLVETVVARDGSRSVVQMAYDASGRLVHYDPKLP
jgi:hypothetical protein